MTYTCKLYSYGSGPKLMNSRAIDADKAPRCRRCGSILSLDTSGTSEPTLVCPICHVPSLSTPLRRRDTRPSSIEATLDLDVSGVASRTIGDRIQYLADRFTYGSQKRFAKEVGIAQTIINRVVRLSRRGEPSSFRIDKVERICKRYPTIDRYWLVTGTASYAAHRKTKAVAAMVGHIHSLVGRFHGDGHDLKDAIRGARQILTLPPTMSSSGERLQYYHKRVLGTGYREFAGRLCIDTPRKHVTSGTVPMVVTIQTYLEQYPALDADWLVTGKFSQAAVEIHEAAFGEYERDLLPRTGQISRTAKTLPSDRLTKRKR